MIKIVVGSKNPVKIQAVSLAFSAVWPEKEVDVIGVSVVSGISNQPMSAEESILGARNRASQAMVQYERDFSVGLEGGLEEIDAHWYCCGWIVVHSRDRVEGVGSTARLAVPELMMKEIRKGRELGEVVDVIFLGENLKQKGGHFGCMTNSVITRTNGYRDGVVMALASFIHPELF